MKESNYILYQAKANGHILFGIIPVEDYKKLFAEMTKNGAEIGYYEEVTPFVAFALTETTNQAKDKDVKVFSKKSYDSHNNVDTVMDHIKESILSKDKDVEKVKEKVKEYFKRNYGSMLIDKNIFVDIKRLCENTEVKKQLALFLADIFKEFDIDDKKWEKICIQVFSV